MKRAVSLLIMMVALLVTGCTNYQNDPFFVEVQNGNGFYINAERPTMILNNQIVVPLIEDERLIGKWIVASEQGEATITFGDDNFIYINDQQYAHWYWFAPDMILTDTGYQTSLIYFMFDGDNHDLMLFSEMDEQGNTYTFIAVRDGIIDATPL